MASKFHELSIQLLQAQRCANSLQRNLQRMPSATYRASLSIAQTLKIAEKPLNSAIIPSRCALAHMPRTLAGTCCQGESAVARSAHSKRELCLEES